MSWNLRQIREPGLAHLLPPASLIQFDHEIRVFNFKISRRIVEGEVPILTNAQKGDIDRRRSLHHDSTRRPLARTWDS